jgi:hypothetical protein
MVEAISLISTSALPLKFLIIFPACLPEHPRRSHKTYLVIFRLIQFRDHFNPSRRLRLCHAAMIERVLCSGDAQTLKERRRECVDFGFSLDLDTAWLEREFDCCRGYEECAGHQPEGSAAICRADRDAAAAWSVGGSKKDAFPSMAASGGSQLVH